MEIRNGLTVLTKITSVYPVMKKSGANLERRVRFLDPRILKPVAHAWQSWSLALVWTVAANAVVDFHFRSLSVDTLFVVWTSLLSWMLVHMLQIMTLDLRLVVLILWLIKSTWQTNNEGMHELYCLGPQDKRRWTRRSQGIGYRCCSCSRFTQGFPPSITPWILVLFPTWIWLDDIYPYNY